MRVKYLTDKAYETLIDNIAVDKDKYMQDDVWLPNYFDGKEFYKESRIDVVPITLHMDGDKNASDLINTRYVFDTYGEMTPQQASNPYLWSYLSMVDFWKYTKWRWGKNMDGTKNDSDDEIVNEEAAKQGESKRTVNIKQRYLCTPSRIGLLRNSLSRLWWYGYLSFQEESPAHKYDLTKLLLSQSDLCQNIVERNFSMNKEISIGILSAIKEINDNPSMRDVGAVNNGDHYEWRPLCKYINRYGGVALLDTLTRNDIKELSYEFIMNYRKKWGL